MLAYANAALATSVGLLATVKSAEAKIVYTPADVKIPVNGGAVPLDLNHDGIVDFVFSNRLRTSGSGGSLATLYVGTGGGTRNKFWGRGIAGTDSQQRFASALQAGFSIRSNESYFQKSPKGIMARVIVYYYPAAAAPCIPHTGGCRSNTMGQWLYTRNRYLGLRFLINGYAHYGWARIAVNRPATGNSIVATLTGYAYETIPNKPIVAGKTKGPDVINLEPAGLGRLAQGAPGIPAWRGQK